ncbi:hypothetical protein [Streptosporangium vulgare]|uniref:D-alanyl-D-alanine carboxypeptidase n=1 Tax=Streptosporangium vulgare TaxID=46190 RepID=A0ABV5TBT0_9ACTN
MSEDTTERDIPEKDPPPAGPRGVDGETRVVAERSGSDTTFPERPLLADPDDARRTPEEESPEGASDAEADDGDDGTVPGDGAEDGEAGEADGDTGNAGNVGNVGNDAGGNAGEGEGTAGDGAPEPEVGPAS